MFISYWKVYKKNICLGLNFITNIRRGQNSKGWVGNFVMKKNIPPQNERYVSKDEKKTHFWIKFLSSLHHNKCFSRALSKNKFLFLDMLAHSLEITGLRSMKCSSETLQNLLYFMYKKTHVVFFVFHFVQLYMFTLWMPWSMST